MFTAILGTRALVNLYYGRRQVDHLSIGLAKSSLPASRPTRRAATAPRARRARAPEVQNMQILSGKTNIDFLRFQKPTRILSIALVVLSLVLVGVRGLNFGIDFTGGTLVEVKYAQAADLDAVRAELDAEGFQGAVVQNFGSSTDVLVRLPPTEGVSKAELSDELLNTLRSVPGGDGAQLERVDFVGPQVGEELTEQGGLAMLFALGAIFIYVLLRFEWRFSAGAVAALFHDVLIVLGLFALFQMEFDLPVLAALLAVIGYSLNDTIVIFDRIRENFRVMRRGSTESVINTSLNQTLSRTVMTSITTLLVLLALFVFGGDLIHNFSIALILGVIVGTYSSIYVAASTAQALGVSRADLMPTVAEDGEADAQP